MNSEIKADISVLKMLLSKGLYLDNLEELIEICNSIIKKLAKPLPVYVLLSIFSAIYHSWDDRPVLVEEKERTEAALLPYLEEVTNLIETSPDSSKLLDSLNSLVSAYIHLEI